METGPFQAGAARNTPIAAASLSGENPVFEIARRENGSRSLTVGVRRAHSRLRIIKPSTQETEEIVFPDRKYECRNYETCLGLAAALNWKSFTCGSCCGEVNEQLLWRAHHQIRNNPALTKLCALPALSR